MQSHPREVVALKTKHGREVLIYHFVGGKPESLIEAGLIDAVIIEAEDGFSQLGSMRNFLSRDLGLQERNLVKYALDGMPSDFEKNISSLADWSRFKRDEVTLVALPTQREGGHLKGLILAPYCGGQLISDTAIGLFSAMFRSKTAGDRLPNTELSRSLL